MDRRVKCQAIRWNDGNILAALDRFLAACVTTMAAHSGAVKCSISCMSIIIYVIHPFVGFYGCQQYLLKQQQYQLLPAIEIDFNLV